MSRIDDLITDLAPNGVAFKALGDVGEFIRGNGLQKSDLTESGFPAIHYGQIHTIYGTWITTTKSFTGPALAVRLRRARPGDLVIATTSEDDDAVAKATAWLGEGEAAVSGDAYIYRHTLNPKYLAYLFQAEHFHDQKVRHITGTKVRRVSGTALAKLRIPVPPLEIQQEIVRILDQFSQLEAELGAALEAELAARLQQYQHYRCELLSFGREVQYVPLSEIAEYVNGKAHEKLADPDGDVPMVTARFISRNGEANRFVRPENVLTPARAGDIAMVLSDLPNGRALARTFFVEYDDAYAINQRVARLRVQDQSVLLPKFLYYVLDRNAGLMKYDNGMDQTHLSRGQVTSLRVPLPPLAEQQRIVEALDSFETSVNELSSSLPSEREARRKQYEHYRDRLLSFEEAVA